MTTSSLARTNPQLTTRSRNLADLSKTRLLAITEKIDNAILLSNETLEGIKKRGAIANLLSSDRDDLIAVAKVQNQVNNLMMEMMQEVIAVNVMGYACLASVINEFRVSVKDGWTDSEGRFHQLSQTGKSFADTATTIFTSILEGSRSTQEAISSNTVAISQVEEQIEEIALLDQRQSRDIVTLEQEVSENRRLMEMLQHAVQARFAEMIEEVNQQQRAVAISHEASIADFRVQLDKTQQEGVAQLQEHLAKADAQADKAFSALQTSVEETRSHLERMHIELESRFEHAIEIGKQQGHVIGALETSLAEARTQIEAMKQNAQPPTPKLLVPGLAFSCAGVAVLGLKAFGIF